MANKKNKMALMTPYISSARGDQFKVKNIIKTGLINIKNLMFLSNI